MSKNHERISSAIGTTRKARRKNIYVVSSAEKVELFINGVSKGFGTQSSRFLYTFKDIEWQSGEIKAVGYDATGKTVTQDAKKTAGEPAAIRLSTQTGPAGLQADGFDVALVTVEVVDNNGNRCPTALDMIDFTLTGEAEWRGGIAQGPDNYVLAKSLPVEGGINRVLIRSTRKAGEIRLKASTKDGVLRSAEIKIDSRPFITSNGLSTKFLSDYTNINLDRGPTPLGESYKMLRRTLDVASVTAGSETDKAKNSLDDNELSEWISDGKTGYGLDTI